MLIINELKKKLSEFYVFEEVAEQINQKLDEFTHSELFREPVEIHSFCNKVTKILQSVNNVSIYD